MTKVNYPANMPYVKRVAIQTRHVWSAHREAMAGTALESDRRHLLHLPRGPMMIPHLKKMVLNCRLLLALQATSLS